MDEIERRAKERGYKTLRLDWNERGDRNYLKVWLERGIVVTFTQTQRGVRSWPESVDVSDLTGGA